jgi:hypothetical protein
VSIRRRSLVAALLWSLFACVPSGVAAAPVPSCSVPGEGWCLARRIVGDVPDGELGFRFGEPLDVDGDGHADPAAGTRFKLQGVEQTGMATVWSGASGNRVRVWEGETPGGLFGHWVLPVPDLGGDGLADVVITAPNAAIEGTVRGVMVARSPKTGDAIWTRTGEPSEHLGWDLALAGDQNGDGVTDVFAGAPAPVKGHVYLVSGKDGRVLQTYAPRTEMSTFGWYVARLDDLDGDGRADLAVGAPPEKGHAGVDGSACVLSSASGAALRCWESTSNLSGFGEIVAAVADLDGDRRGEIAVGSPRTNDHTRTNPGEVDIYSSGTGRPLHRWSGTQAGELYGRMVVGAGDLDSDGVEDIAIAAPWHRREGRERAGRVEFRSGRDATVLSELSGDAADAWFGWHIRRAPDPDGLGRPALLISSLREPVDGRPGVGALDLYVFRK